MKSGWYVCAVVLLGPACALSGTGSWRNYTSMQEVRSIVRDGSAVWAATSGGLFRWTSSPDHYLLLTNAEGLRTIDLTAVNVDQQGNVWSGSANGTVHVYTPATGTVRLILDIAASNQTNKRVNAISIAGDTSLFCTEFGLSLFHAGRFEFGDTYSRFGTIPAGTRVAVTSALLHGGFLWACITDGQSLHRIAFASLSQPNLLPPEAWTLQTVGGIGTIPKVLAVFAGKLYAGTSSGLFVEQGGTWSEVAALSGRNITALSTSTTQLVATTIDRAVLALAAGDIVTPVGSTLPEIPTALVIGENGNPIVGTSTTGLLAWNTTWSVHVPNGPNSNQFLNVLVDPDGVLWCASGDVSGRGLYRYDGTTWTSFTTANSPLPANEVYRLSSGTDGTVWASTYGRGVVALPRGSTRIDSQHVYGKNIGMPGLASDPNYVVVSNVASDSRGNAWMSVVLAGDRNVFSVRRSDGTWRHFPAIINGIKMSQLMERVVDRCLAVDAFDNIWATVRDGGYRGILCLGNGGAIDSTAAFHLGASNGLPSSEVKTLLVDTDNDIWVGTDRGIGIILEPSNPMRTGSIAAYKPLTGLVINTIAVDPLNQKWVGTTEGALLLSPDGTQTLASYTVESTDGKLMDNDVKSISVDAKTGTVYFGTMSGLASLTTPAAAPRASFDGLTVFPNPFLVPSAEPLTVSGLVAESQLKILTVDGKVIRNIATPGGLVGTWDGKDAEGEFVASGVYLIVAYAQDGSAVATGKVALIKR